MSDRRRLTADQIQAKKKNEERDEKILERIVLGKGDDFIAKLNKIKPIRLVDPADEHPITDSDDSDYEGENLVTKDYRQQVLKEGDTSSSQKNVSEDKDNAEEHIDESDKASKRVAWEDEDDDIRVEEGFKNAYKKPRKVGPNQKYKDYLESKFSTIHQPPKWALDKKAKPVDSDSEEDELFQTASDYATGSKSLPKNLLNVKSCVHLNHEAKVKGIISSIQFHAKSPVALVAARTGAVNLFQVDGDENAKLKSLQFDNFEIDRVRYTIDGDELIIGSKLVSGYFYSYDLMAEKVITHPLVRGRDRYYLEKFTLSPDGKYIACRGLRGAAHVLDSDTKEILYSLQMSDDVISLAFSSNSSKLHTHTNGGRVYTWDLRKRNSCLNKFSDDGCIAGTMITVSPNGQFLATGSDSGVVNIYNVKDVETQTIAKPVKTIMNLTTEVTSLNFNGSSELLSMASSFGTNAIRYAHVPSFSVFSNFPIVGQVFNHVTEVDISPNSGYVAFGNNKGVVNLHRLCHYKEY